MQCNAATKGYYSRFSKSVFGRQIGMALLLLIIALVQGKPSWAASPPVLQEPTATPSTPFALDTQQPVVLSVTYTDDPLETHYVIITWDDGTTCEAHGLAPDTSGTEYCSINNDTDTVTASHLYTAPGVYSPSIVIATEGQGSGGKKGKQYRYVVIYDDNKGHIKGAGGFDLVHQYSQMSTADGPAQFGFTVGYNADGTFRSNSRVRFALYNDSLTELFAFASTTFNWLVISGPNAVVSGTGIINGDTTTPYNYVLSIIDGGLQSPPGPDRFRIRITRQTTGSLYYDNEFAPIPTRDIMLFDPTTAIGGGEITIASAPGVASAHRSELIVIGNAPEDVVANIGQSRALYMPFAAD